MLSRRSLLKSALAIGPGLWASTQVVSSRAAANDKLDIAVIGAGGRGRANLNAVANENIVAICDVDDKRVGDAYQVFPKAERFADFRRMYDRIEQRFDAVVISTPDHTHFHPAYMAMEMGKHVYLEKPMAHSVWEVRTLTELAKEKGIATQLGVQRHTIPNVHRVVELVKSGAIGTVKDVYCWVGGTRGMPAIPTSFPPVPPHLKWDLWLGPAKNRPYSPAYAPYNWRFWWDFGTGETGNWGCHILDIPYWALDLDKPTHVSASGPDVHEQTTPKQMESHLKFPARGSRPAVTLHWSHAKNGPPILRELGLSPKGMNTLFVGSKGQLLCGFGQRQLHPVEKFADFTPPPKSIPESPGFYKEWTDACRGGDPATCDFSYSGPMTETVLLANAAYRAGGEFTWDAATLTAKNNDRVGRYLTSDFRKGWEIAGL